jgi:ABC-type transport system involved in multi-copper enzyme maturation permease subunit
VFIALLGVLLTMTALAGVLGWSSHHTIVGVYGEAVKLLASRGQPAPPNPFLLKPSLSLLSNMVVYIPLIGALFALLLGHLSLADDETGGVGRLVFSRSVSRTSYVFGKIVGAAGILAVILTASLVVSAVSLVIVDRALPATGDLGRLVLFYALSWLYLMVFALIGMVTVLVTERRSLALLSGMGVWLVVTFVLPQVTSGLRPTQSLNPITDPASTSQAFFRVTSKARPFSVVEQYKEASGRILQTTSAESTMHTLGRIAPLLALFGVLIMSTVTLVQRHDYSRGSNGE